jgi:hypothetical protein
MIPEGRFMSAKGAPGTEIDPALFGRNRQWMPPELLEPYAGQWVALNVECTRVLASGPDLKTAEANLAALGIPGNSVGWERVPEADEDSWL